MEYVSFCLNSASLQESKEVFVTGRRFAMKIKQVICFFSFFAYIISYCSFLFLAIYRKLFLEDLKL